VNILLVLGWLFLIVCVLVVGGCVALICAASWLRCKNCRGFHDSTECDNVDWRTE